MKRTAIALFVCISILSISAVPAMCDVYDAEWVAQCILDNKDARVSVEVITKYCVCMSNKMSRSETRSVTEWEKTHPEERRDCDRQAGWK